MTIIPNFKRTVIICCFRFLSGDDADEEKEAEARKEVHVQLNPHSRMFELFELSFIHYAEDCKC